MELNEIKKLLYKENPNAQLMQINKQYLCYRTKVPQEDKTLYIHFAIPIHDIGDADFYAEMEAKYLIRWIINE
jgi:hypothetical protein